MLSPGGPSPRLPSSRSSSPRLSPRLSSSPSPSSNPSPRRGRRAHLLPYSWSASATAFPLLRARVHPLVLVPVFLLGLLVARAQSSAAIRQAADAAASAMAIASSEQARVLNTNAHAGAGDWALPPDAPPLDLDAGDDSAFGSPFARPPPPRSRRGDLVLLPDDDDALAQDGLLERDGYLYYSASAPAVEMDVPHAHADRTKRRTLKEEADRERVQREHERSVRQRQQEAAAKAKAKQAAVAARPKVGAGIAAGGKLARNAPEYGPDGRKLGPNAAAAMRAQREGKPFVPKKPADMLAEQRQKAIDEQIRFNAEHADEIKRAAEKRKQDRLRKEQQQHPPAAPARQAPQPLAAQRLRPGAAPAAAAAAAPPPPPLPPRAKAAAPFPAPAARNQPQRVVAGDLGDDYEQDLKRRGGAAGAGAAAGAGRQQQQRKDDEPAAGKNGRLAVMPRAPRGRQKRDIIFDLGNGGDGDGNGNDDGASGEQSYTTSASSASRGAEEDGSAKPKLRKRALLDEQGEDDQVVVGPAFEDEVEGSNDDEGEAATAAKVGPRHPILHLMEQAEAKWADMLQRQSQTLEDAVLEYQRRYRRNPPLGFDKWWRFAMANHVVLVDEYDQIWDDIEPFHALSPLKFKGLAGALASDLKLASHAHSFTLNVRDAKLSPPQGVHKDSARAEDTVDILNELVELLPDMQLTFSTDDTPSICVSGDLRRRAVDHARVGTHVGLTPADVDYSDELYAGWSGVCPPQSNIRRAIFEDLVPPSPVSFVSLDHASAMDVCAHPEIQHKHGYTQSTLPHLSQMYPLLVPAKTSMHMDIVSPTLDGFYDALDKDPVWARKTHNKVLWRGSSTGIHHEKGAPWIASHRSRLNLITAPGPGNLTVRVPDSDEGGARVRKFDADKTDVNGFYFDVSFAGTPIHCSRADGTCMAMEDVFDFDDPMEVADQNDYKYQLDVDGTGWSSRFRRLLSSRSAVIKSTIFQEWWSKRLVPWFHYIPVKSDLSDLHDVTAFFIGAPDGTGSHDLLGMRIGENGRLWARDHWREADVAAYQLRLFLEYARLANREMDGSGFDFVL